MRQLVLSPMSPLTSHQSLRAVFRSPETAQNLRQVSVKNDPKCSNLTGSKSGGSRTEMRKSGGTDEEGWRAIKEEAEKPGRARRLSWVVDLLYLISICR